MRGPIAKVVFVPVSAADVLIAAAGVVGLSVLLIQLIRLLILLARVRRQTIVAAADYRETDIGRMPSEVATPMSAAVRALLPLGFRAVCHLQAHDVIPNSEGFHSAWIDADGSVLGQIVHVRLRAGASGRWLAAQGVAFTTAFDDETWVTTSNAHQVRALIPDPRIDVVRWPGMQDLGVLYQLHRARVEALRGTRAVLPAPATATSMAEFLRNAHARSIEQQVRHGEMTFDEVRGVYVNTFRGAMAKVLRQVWPCRGRLRREAEARLRAALAAANMGRPEDYSAASRPGPPPPHA